MPSTTLGETLGGPSLSRSLSYAGDENDRGGVPERKGVSDGKMVGGWGRGGEI